MLSMPKTSAGLVARGRRFQAGVGLVELMIAILISMILLFGLFSFVYGSRQTFTAQNQLARLQDNERMAMTLLSGVIQTAGYYPNPTGNPVSAALPVSNPYFTSVGQSIYGTAGDQIWVRYEAGNNDDVMDCTGQTNTGAAPMTVVNTFYVNANQLVCQATDNGVAGAAVPLVSGVTGMTILYGVDTNGDGSADQYLPAATVAANGQWGAVVSVQVQLTFANPLTGSTAMTTTAGVLTLTRNIDLLNRI
jgi:type IV pilus assembly protein PilW